MKKILIKPLIWSLLLLFLSCNRGSSNLDLTPEGCSTGAGLKAVNRDFLNQEEYYLARFQYDKVTENNPKETRSCPAHVIKGAMGKEETAPNSYYLIATLSYSCVRDMIESALSRYGDQQNPEDQSVVFGTFFFSSKDERNKYTIDIGTKIGDPNDKISLAEADFGNITLNSEIFSNQNIKKQLKDQLNSYQNVRDSLSQQEFYFNNMAILGFGFFVGGSEDPFTNLQSQPIKSNENFNEVALYVLSQLENHFTNGTASTDNPPPSILPPIGKPPIDIAICEILPKTEAPQGLPASCGGINNKYQVTFSTAAGHSDKIKAVVSDKNSGAQNGSLDLSTVEGGSFLIADGKVLGIIPENPNAPSTTLAGTTTPSVSVDIKSTEETYQEFLAKQGLGGTGGVGGLVINDNDPKWLQAVKLLSPLTQILFTRQRNDDNVRRVQGDVEETQKQIDTIQQSSGDDDSGDNTQLQQLLEKVDKQTQSLEKMQGQIDAQKLTIAGLLRGNSNATNGGTQTQKKDCPDE